LHHRQAQAVDVFTVGAEPHADLTQPYGVLEKQTDFFTNIININNQSFLRLNHPSPTVHSKTELNLLTNVITIMSDNDEFNKVE
jgi:hypothetical protein